jgi:hypothetical protein
VSLLHDASHVFVEAASDDSGLLCRELTQSARANLTVRSCSMKPLPHSSRACLTPLACGTEPEHHFKLRRLLRHEHAP